MLSAEIVIKNLSRATTASEEAYKFFADRLDKRLTVRSIDFDGPTLWTEHGIFHIVVVDEEADTVHALFTYHGISSVDFELYIGGNQVWPKQ